MSYLRYLWFVLCTVVFNTYCVLFFIILCTLCCQFLCVFHHLVHSMLPVSLCFSSSCAPYVASFSVFFIILCTLCCQFLCVFHHLVHPMLPVSLCFSSSCAPYVASFSGLSLRYSLTFLKNDIYMDMKVKLSVKHKKE
jgi:hypothetical protein